MDKNEALKIIYNDLKHHHEFGSLFQFWASQIKSELESKLDIDDDTIHDIAISIVKRIGQFD